jgi:hypothetical protein
MHPIALLMSLGAHASLDTLTMPSPDTQIITAYANESLAQLMEPAGPERASRLRLGAVTIHSTQAATEARAHESLSTLLRQRAVHLEHCSQHAPADTDVQVDLTFAVLPRLHADAAPTLATCLQALAEHWPVPQDLRGTRATLRLVVEARTSP